jgi:hypothetical protein
MMTSTVVGTKMTSTIASTMMTATAIAGHNKHSLYLYLPVCATIAPPKRDDEDKFYYFTRAARPARASPG